MIQSTIRSFPRHTRPNSNRLQWRNQLFNRIKTTTPTILHMHTQIHTNLDKMKKRSQLKSVLPTLLSRDHHELKVGIRFYKENTWWKQPTTITQTLLYTLTE